MKEPLFSIIVPVYNTEEFLDDCINSVVTQSYHNWELILIDDGSTDTSGLIIDSYQNNYSGRIRAFHKINEGQFLARKFGIKSSLGDYLIFLDSDDMLEINALEILRNTIVEHANVNLILYDAYHLYSDGSKRLGKDQIDFSGFFEEKKDILRECFLKRTSRISMCSYCFKGDLIRSINLNPILSFTIKSQEDFMMVYDIVKKVHSLIIIGVPLYIYRDNPKSITHVMDARTFYDGLSVSSTIYRELINDFSFDITCDFEDYIIHRLAWLPISFLIRACREYSRKDLKIAWKSIKSDFLFVNFTKKAKIKAKSYWLFLFMLRINLFRAAKYIALRFLD